MRQVLALVCVAAGCAWASEPEVELQGLVAEHEARRAAGEGPGALAPLESRIDALAGARDAAYSGLLWHRDEESARREAQARGRPVLSLRLPGELWGGTDCPEGRFLRATLYSDAELASWLRQRVVLHWERCAEPPAPGGAAVHGLLLPDGELVAVLPGLYGPRAFREALEPAVEAAQAALRLPEGRARRHRLWQYRRGTRATLELRRAALGVPPPTPVMTWCDWVLAKDLDPEELALHGLRPEDVAGKDLVISMLKVQNPTLPPLGARRWEVVTAAFVDRCRLDARSRSLLARNAPPGRREPEEVEALAARCERLMTLSTARSELWLRLGGSPEPTVYDEVPGWRTAARFSSFERSWLERTPEDDEWRGLALDDPTDFGER